MNYLSMIFKYYKNLSGTFTYTNNVSGKAKMQINISGKIKNFFLIFWLGISSVFIIFNLLNHNKLIVILLSIISITATLLKSRRVYKKLEHEPLNLDLYKRDLPSKLKPAHVRMILNDGLVDEISLCATWLDLIDRGYISLRREKEDLIFTRTNKEEKELFEFEKFLIKWFINKYGDGKEISSKQINYCLTNNIYKERPYELFDYFQNRVWISFPLEKFYNVKDDMSKKRMIYMFLVVISFIQVMHIWSLPLIIYSLGCSMFATPYMYLNDRGIEEKDHWLDFKKHLIDFSNIEDKTTEMVKIWNFYLTYSIALDINSISSEEIKNIFKDDIYNGYAQNSNTYKIESNEKQSEKYIIPEYVNKTLENDVLEERKKYDF